MPDFNQVILMGRLTRDIELRRTPGGYSVADMGLAINSYKKSKTGQREEETTFVSVTIWGKSAENAAQYLHKGSPVHVTGRLRTESWTDKNGQKKSKLSVVSSGIQYLEKKQSFGQNQNNYAQNPYSPNPQQNQYSAPPPQNQAPNYQQQNFVAPPPPPPATQQQNQQNQQWTPPPTPPQNNGWNLSANQQQAYNAVGASPQGDEPPF